MIRWLRSLFAWRVTSETWAWIHYKNDVTGEVRNVQKVRGVPMAPPPRDFNAPLPPRPTR